MGMKNRFPAHRLHALFFIGFLAVLAVLVAVIGNQNEKKSKAKLDATSKPEFCDSSREAAFTLSQEAASFYEHSGIDEDTASLYSVNVLLVETTVVTVDLAKKVNTIRFQFYPLGDFIANFASMDHLGRAAPKYDMNITVVGYATFSFPRGKVITRQELSVPIDGDLNEYPFDEWETAPLIVEGTFRNTSASANPAAEVVPLISITWGQLQDYKTEFPVSTNCLTTNDVNIAGQASIQAVISRTVTTKIYSIMITTMLWILSIFVIGVSLVILLQRRVAEPPVIAFTAAILFAIPNVRNAQPGVPGIGCNLDVYAYLWNVSLCALALTFNLGNFLFHQYQKGLPPKQSAPPAGVQVHVDEILVERK